MDETARVIKRYSNRKLYDMKDSRYITLEKIADYVRHGQEIRVVDNHTGEDLTAVILSQILFETEKKKHGGFLPVSTLQTILQSGEQVLQRTIGAPVSSVKEGAEKMVADLMGEAEKALGRVVKKGSELDGQVGAIRAALGESVQKRMDEFLSAVDARLKVLTETGNRFAASVKEIDTLRKRLDEMEKLVKRRRK